MKHRRWWNWKTSSKPQGYVLFMGRVASRREKKGGLTMREYKGAASRMSTIGVQAKSFSQGSATA